MMRIIGKVKQVSWFEFCNPCEMPYHVYRSIESKGKRTRTLVRMFERPMAERFCRNVMRKNHEPNGRWVAIYPAIAHNEYMFVEDYYNFKTKGV